MVNSRTLHKWGGLNREGGLFQNFTKRVGAHYRGALNRAFRVFQKLGFLTFLGPFRRGGSGALLLLGMVGS